MYRICNIFVSELKGREAKEGNTRTQESMGTKKE